MVDRKTKVFLELPNGVLVTRKNSERGNMYKHFFIKELVKIDKGNTEIKNVIVATDSKDWKNKTGSVIWSGFVDQIPKDLYGYDITWQGMKFETKEYYIGAYAPDLIDEKKRKTFDLP